jgi:hypothetical protein
MYLEHRVIWLWVTGEWPLHGIDHIDGVKDNNRWANLRDVSPSVNSQNTKRAKAGSSTGLLGVTRMGSRFQAKIMTRGKMAYLGTFATGQLAHEAYLAAKRELHEGNTL